MKTSHEALQPYLEHLRQLPFVEQATAVQPGPRENNQRQVDMFVAIKTPTGEKKLPCELKGSYLLKETAQHFVHLAHEIPDLLLLAPAIGRELGDLFQHERVNFLDLAGNCYLNLDDRYIARLQGRVTPRPRAADKGLRAASYRVIFAMLAEPALVGATTRKLAEAAGGLSPQTVSDVRERLQQRGALLRTRSGFRWARNGRRDAVELWLAGFSATLFPKLLNGRFRAREADPDRLEAELSPLLDQIGSWRWGGGAAAMRLTQFYRGDQTVIYFKETPPTDAARRLHLVPDRDGPLYLVEAPGPLAFSGPNQETAHPLLVYADLLREASQRAGEAAQMLRDRLLRDMETGE